MIPHVVRGAFIKIFLCACPKITRYSKNCLRPHNSYSFSRPAQGKSWFIGMLFVAESPIHMGLPLFGQKKSLVCTVCGRELRHKYKPSKDWNMQGFLCADCHIEKTKEFALKEQEPEVEKCALCARQIEEGESKKARWQWNLEAGAVVCAPCFEKRDREHERLVNFCASCNVKMGVIRYNPKPEWKVEGQLCRKCWDSKNRREVAQ